MKRRHKSLDFFDKNHLVIFLVIFQAICIYSTTFFSTYGIHNDYSFLNLKNGFLCYPESPVLIGFGRFLNAVVLSLQMLTIYSVNDFSVWRCIAFLTALASSIIIYYNLSFKESFLDKDTRAIISFAFIYLPSVQLYIVWATNYSNVLSVFFAVSAYYLYDKFPNNFILSRVLPFTFLLASVSLYPIGTSTFLIPLFVEILFSTNIYTSREVFHVSLFYLYSLGTYYFFAIKITVPLVRHLAPGYICKLPDSYSTNLGFSLNEKINSLYFLAKTSFGAEFDLVARHGWILGIIVLIFLVLIRLSSKSSLYIDKSRLTKSLYIFIVALFPVLIPKDIPSSYRITLCATYFVFVFKIYLISSSFRLKQKRRLYFCWALYLSLAIIAQYNIYNVNLNFSREFTASTVLAKKIKFLHPSHVYCVKIPVGSTFANTFLNHDFSLLGSANSWIGTSGLINSSSDNSPPITDINMQLFEKRNSMPVVFLEYNSILFDFNEYRPLPFFNPDSLIDYMLFSPPQYSFISSVLNHNISRENLLSFYNKKLPYNGVITAHVFDDHSTELLGGKDKLFITPHEPITTLSFVFNIPVKITLLSFSSRPMSVIVYRSNDLSSWTKCNVIYNNSQNSYTISDVDYDQSQFYKFIISNSEIFTQNEISILISKSTT